MSRKRDKLQIGFHTARKKRTTTVSHACENHEDIQRFSNPKSNLAIPLSSIYYRFFENIENRPVPNYTIPPYEQISKLSPQTSLNKRRCVVGK